jgi:hypothetical protein
VGHLVDRAPGFAGFVPEMAEIIAQTPRPEDGPLIVAMAYGPRMAALYHQLAGDLPREVTYQLAWQMPPDLAHRTTLTAVVDTVEVHRLGHVLDVVRPDILKTELGPAADCAVDKIRNANAAYG